MIRISLNAKFQGTKKNDIFSQGTDDAKTFRRETLYTADYEYVNIPSFAVVDIKLWLEEDGHSNRDHPLYSLKFIQSKVQNSYKM